MHLHFDGDFEITLLHQDKLQLWAQIVAERQLKGIITADRSWPNPAPIADRRCPTPSGLHARIARAFNRVSASLIA